MSRQPLRMARAVEPRRAADPAARVGPVWPVWMTATTAAVYLGFIDCADPVDAFRKHVDKHGPQATGGRGDRPLWHIDDLDRAVSLVERG